jgi:predicted GIY-YIG superfamily endonuclease
MGYIYKISNIINNKLYIGMTRYNIEHRWKEHKSSY